MFSNSAYEALYQLLGLSLHAKFIEWITGETFFKMLVLMIFGTVFFFTLLKFVSRYLPGSLIDRKQIPLSRFVKVVACLFLGLAILRVGTDADVKDFQGKSWADNAYVRSHANDVKSEYRVSVVFNLMSRTAEELTALLSRIIDGVFAKEGTSQLTAPNMFYKAIMYAGTTTIDDPGLRDQLRFYSEECFSKVIPSLGALQGRAATDEFFRGSREIDRELADVSIDTGEGKTTSCLEIKESTFKRLEDFSRVKTEGFFKYLPWPSVIGIAEARKYDANAFKNYTAAAALSNFYADQKESRLGLQRGADIPGGAAQTFSTLGRVFSWDGILGMLGMRDVQGASEAAKRSQAFSEHLSRAPHVAGFVRMLLIAAFPFLMFFVVAGKWRVLLIWFWIYFSVLLWTPLWTLLYHVMLGIAQSSEVMEQFGNLNDGVSLYAASVIRHRIYYMFSIYSWLQVLVATLTTGSAFMFLKPMLGESSEESAPEFLGTAQGLAGTGVDIGTAKGAGAVAKAVL